MTEGDPELCNVYDSIDVFEIRPQSTILSSPGSKLLTIDVNSRIREQKKLDLKKKFKISKNFYKSMSLRTSANLREGMTKPALFRNMRESSVGYNSFNKARMMYPNELDQEKKISGFF